MPQSAEVKKRGAAPGTYGPENPPPPPPGPPPGGANSAQGRNGAANMPPPSQKSPPVAKYGLPHEKPFELLNSRQRKARKRDLDAARAQCESHGRSRSPVRRKWEGSQFRYPASPTAGQNGDHEHRPDMMAIDTRRQPLADARQVTPDQIRDETYGRLSPGNGSHDRYQQTRGDAHGRPAARNEGPGQQSWSPRSVGEHAGQTSQGRGYWDEPNNSSSARSAHGGATGQYGRANSMAPLPAASTHQAFEIEDEVDWDDDDPVDVPAPVQPPPMPQFGGAKPQQAAYKGPTQGPNGQGQKRGFSVAREEQPWEQRPYQTNAQKRKHPKPSSQWAPEHAQRQPNAQFGQPHHQGFNGHHQPDMTPFRRPVVNPSDLALLDPDPALIPGPPAPETVYDLRKYDAHITALHKGLPKSQKFINGNGKAAPFLYGSAQGRDLGLCYSTFCTSFKCEMGVKCAWRHHPLTKAEREWILTSGKDAGKRFLENLVNCWAVPDIPVPGASMHEK